VVIVPLSSPNLIVDDCLLPLSPPDCSSMSLVCFLWSGFPKSEFDSGMVLVTVFSYPDRDMVLMRDMVLVTVLSICRDLLCFCRRTGSFFLVRSQPATGYSLVWRIAPQFDVVTSRYLRLPGCGLKAFATSAHFRIELIQRAPALMSWFITLILCAGGTPPLLCFGLVHR